MRKVRIQPHRAESVSAYSILLSMLSIWTKTKLDAHTVRFRHAYSSMHLHREEKQSHYRNAGAWFTLLQIPSLLSSLTQFPTAKTRQSFSSPHLVLKEEAINIHKIYFKQLTVITTFRQAAIKIKQYHMMRWAFPLKNKPGEVLSRSINASGQMKPQHAHYSNHPLNHITYCGE